MQSTKDNGATASHTGLVLSFIRMAATTKDSLLQVNFREWAYSFLVKARAGQAKTGLITEVNGSVRCSKEMVKWFNGISAMKEVGRKVKEMEKIAKSSKKIWAILS